jgi:hypothetical protein
MISTLRFIAELLKVKSQQAAADAAGASEGLNKDASVVTSQPRAPNKKTD